MVVDRELPNLGGHVLGRAVTYEGADGRMAKIVVGYNPADALEDLDFVVTEIVALRTYAVATTALAPEIVIVAWEEPRLDPPCGAWAVSGRSLTVSEALAFADAGVTPDGLRPRSDEVPRPRRCRRRCGRLPPASRYSPRDDDVGAPIPGRVRPLRGRRLGCGSAPTPFSG